MRTDAASRARMIASIRRRLVQREIYGNSEGRWVTIGGHPEGDKQHAGGTPVQIDKEGKILKGPPNLKGKDLDALDKGVADAGQTSEDRLPSAASEQEPVFRLRSEPARKPQPVPEQRKLFDLVRDEPESPLAKAIATAHPVAAAIARGHTPHRLKNDGTDQPPPGVHVTPQGAWTGPTTLHAQDIIADPQRFQYKVVGVGESGVTEELADVKQFNPLYGGQLLVWRDPVDGKTYVINGHHRLELAKRSPHYTDPNTGLSWQGEMQVYYVPATSAKEARALGALANIAEGRGTATDAAKFLRDTGKTVEDLTRTGISLRGRIAADAQNLANLSDRAFQALATGRIDEGRALAIARHLKDHDLQDQLLARLERRDREGKPLPDAHVAEMAREMALAGKTEGGGRSLFGDDFFGPESLIEQRAELKAFLRNALSHDASTFKAVSSARRVSKIQEAGNVLDVEANRQRAQAAEQARFLFDKLANVKGPLAELIQQAARELKNEPRRKKEIAERLRRAVHELLQQHWHQVAGFGTGETQRAAMEPYRRNGTAIAGRRGAGTSHRQPRKSARQSALAGISGASSRGIFRGRCYGTSCREAMIVAVSLALRLR